WSPPMQWLALPSPWRDEPGAPATAAAGWWALQFTPRVAVVDGEVLLLELSTTERLWGGRAAQRERVLQAWTAAAGAAASAVAATPAGAVQAGAPHAIHAFDAPHPQAHPRDAHAGSAVAQHGLQAPALKISAAGQGVARA